MGLTSTRKALTGMIPVEAAKLLKGHMTEEDGLMDQDRFILTRRRLGRDIIVVHDRVVGGHGR